MQTAAIRVRPRYHRWLVDPPAESLETNTGYAFLEWKIPLDQAAVVLVDVWDRHYLLDTAERAEHIIQTKIRPLLAGCRKTGLQLIHAPSPPQATGHKGWIGRHAVDSRSAPPSSVDDWPPENFRTKRESYSQYTRPPSPRQELIDRMRSQRRIHPDAAPQGDEVVVATGEELHRYCADRGVLFLFYLGFNTNACILMRDYGTLAMGGRGYEVVLLRDCTTGMESPQSRPNMAQTRGAVLLLEMFGKYSLTSEELLEGLP